MVLFRKFVLIGCVAFGLLLGYKYLRYRLHSPVGEKTEKLKLEEANEKFQQCCKQAGDDCHFLCKYDVQPTEMLDAYVNSKCLFQKLTEALTCATGGKDNTQCCKKANVPEGCLKYCRPTTERLAPEDFWSCSYDVAAILGCHLDAATTT